MGSYVCLLIDSRDPTVCQIRGWISLLRRFRLFENSYLQLEEAQIPLFGVTNYFLGPAGKPAAKKRNLDMAWGVAGHMVLTVSNRLGVYETAKPATVAGLQFFANFPNALRLIPRRLYPPIILFPYDRSQWAERSSRAREVPHNDLCHPR